MNEKQEVIFKLDLLRRYLENFDPRFFCNAVNHKAFVDDLKKAVEMLAREKQPDTEWIPVTEKLPLQFSKVLVTDGEYVGAGYYIASKGWTAEDLGNPVTQWAYMPDPPEVDQP